MAADSTVKSPENKYSNTIGNSLDIVQSTIYLLVAIFLILMAFMAFYIVAQDMMNFVREPASILLVDKALENLMVVFVITGLIQTLIVYIKTHAIDTRLVLAVGLTAVIRRVLVFGATPKPWEDTAMTAVLLFVLILGIFMVARADTRKKHGGE
ncbi:phosphate-starvation-inducible PsiE family protein [Methanocella sp. MCL-LM]|uniref:phosphate-starvation-inducible PsiE family protein n=1 Tax=Methanocella sp. MCL-LM TaxID=3412035 RepID=UPI003C77CF87